MRRIEHEEVDEADAGPLPTLPRLLLLALFFLAGVLLGQVLASSVPDATGDELRRYLEDYLRLGAEGPPPPGRWSPAW